MVLVSKTNSYNTGRKESTLLNCLFSTFFNLMFPIRMLLRLYSFIILIFDVAWVMINAVCAVLQACYELFRPPPLKSIRMEKVLVIGSGRGVGRELAIQLADLGATVLCVDQNKSTNEDTVNIIKKRGGTAASYTCNITKRENVQALAAQIKKEIGFVSMLFYCCGIPSPRSLLTQPPQDIHSILDVTLTSYFWKERKKRKKTHLFSTITIKKRKKKI